MALSFVHGSLDLSLNAGIFWGALRHYLVVSWTFTLKFQLSLTSGEHKFLSHFINLSLQLLWSPLNLLNRQLLLIMRGTEPHFRVALLPSKSVRAHRILLSFRAWRKHSTPVTDFRVFELSSSVVAWRVTVFSRNLIGLFLSSWVTRLETSQVTSLSEIRFSLIK